MQSSVLKYLPLVLAVFVVVGAVAFASQKFIARKKVDGIFTKLPEPTLFIAIPTPTPTSTPTPISQTNESNSTNKSKTQTTKTVSLKTSTETVCTPVYGMANSCAEHAVVDTALDTSIFYNLAGLSYFAGLAAFVKAKRRVA